MIDSRITHIILTLKQIVTPLTDNFHADRRLESRPIRHDVTLYILDWRWRYRDSGKSDVLPMLIRFNTDGDSRFALINVFYRCLISVWIEWMWFWNRGNFKAGFRNGRPIGISETNSTTDADPWGWSIFSDRRNVDAALSDADSEFWRLVIAMRRWTQLTSPDWVWNRPWKNRRRNVLRWCVQTQIALTLWLEIGRTYRGWPWVCARLYLWNDAPFWMLINSETDCDLETDAPSTLTNLQTILPFWCFLSDADDSSELDADFHVILTIINDELEVEAGLNKWTWWNTLPTLTVTNINNS